MNENVKPIQVKNDNPGKVRKRQRSTIGFPYADYDSSLGIATAIHSICWPRRMFPRTACRMDKPKC